MIDSRPVLHYETIRSELPMADWLLLIHGAGGSIRTWKKQREALSKRFNLLLIDLPGHGGSADMFTSIESYSFEYISDTIWKTVDHLKLDKLHIGGLSLGTILALQMKKMRPDRVSSLILAGAIVKLNTRLKMVANFCLNLAKVIGYHSFYKLAARIVLPKTNHKKSRSIFVKESKLVSTAEFKKWTQMYGKDLQATLKKIFEFNISAPTLLVMGAQDHLFLKLAKEYQIRHRLVELSVVNNCGHVVSLEKPSEFNLICQGFLSKVTGLN